MAKIKAAKQTILKLEVSNFTKSETERCFGQTITHAEVRIEDKDEWEKHSETVLKEVEWYCKYRELSEDFSNNMSRFNLFTHKGGNHIAFHDINGTRNRFALFTLTNGKTDTL